MKVTKKQLNKIIKDCLKDDMLNEGEFGRITKGVEFEFCDFSAIPEIFNDFFDAVRNKDAAAIDKEITKQMRKSADRAEIARLEASRELTRTEVGFFESILNHNLTKTLINALGPGLSFLTLTNKADCDYIVATTQNFVYNVLAPTFGLSAERLREEEAKRRALNRSSRSGATAAITAVGGAAVFKVISNAFNNNNITNKENRAKIKNKVIDSKLTNFHFDLFELMAPREYIEFVNNPSEDIKKTAINEFEISIVDLERDGTADFRHWINAFTNTTPGTRDDASVKEILKSANLDEHFDNPKEATEYTRECLNDLIDELDFEGVNILTKI